MYGLVNKAIQDLVTANHGPEVWTAIKSRAGVEVDTFLCMSPYPDQVTYDLVGAAAEELEVPAEQILEAFGEYWIRFSAQEGYGELLQMWGTSLVDFLGNMNNLHARVSLVFPELRPPTIRCTDVSDASLRLHYHSDREGLAPFLIGLVRGLGERFETPVEVTHEVARGAGSDHDTFLVQFKVE